jgi:hypothetical protein
VALFQDSNVSAGEKSQWGGVLIAIIVIAIISSVGAAMSERSKRSSDMTVALPIEKIDGLNANQKKLVLEMLYDFQLYQNIPPDIPLKLARKMLDQSTMNKLWRWRNFGKNSKTATTLQMTVGVDLHQVS